MNDERQCKRTSEDRCERLERMLQTSLETLCLLVKEIVATPPQPEAVDGYFDYLGNKHEFMGWDIEQNGDSVVFKPIYA